MSNAIFLGRFQPFHNGHLYVIKKALKDIDELIIIIGSAQHFNTKLNPFSIDERKAIIKKTLDKEGIKNYKLVEVIDINDDDKYVDYVEKFIHGCDKIFYTGNGTTKELFRHKGYEIRDVGRVDNISATEIKRRIVNNENWEELVPKTAAEEIKKIDGVKRVKELFG